jgi:hypothetical protein
MTDRIILIKDLVHRPKLVRQPNFQVSNLKNLYAAKMQGHVQHKGAAHGRAA